MSNFYAARFAAASVLVGMGMMFFGARVALSFAICAADFFFFFLSFFSFFKLCSLEVGWKGVVGIFYILLCSRVLTRRLSVEISLFSRSFD